jgi:hypothetical protein
VACLVPPTLVAHLWLRTALAGGFLNFSGLAPLVWVLFGSAAGSFWVADAYVVRRTKQLRGVFAPAFALAAVIGAMFWGVFVLLFMIGQGALKPAHAWEAKDAVEGAALWLAGLGAGPGALVACAASLKTRWGLARAAPSPVGRS